MQSVEDIYACVARGSDIAARDKNALLKALSSPDVRIRAEDAQRAQPLLSGADFTRPGGGTVYSPKSHLLAEVAWLLSIALAQLLTAAGDITGNDMLPDEATRAEMTGHTRVLPPGADDELTARVRKVHGVLSRAAKFRTEHLAALYAQPDADYAARVATARRILGGCTLGEQEPGKEFPELPGDMSSIARPVALLMHPGVWSVLCASTPALPFLAVSTYFAILSYSAESAERGHAALCASVAQRPTLAALLDGLCERWLERVPAPPHDGAQRNLWRLRNQLIMLVSLSADTARAIRLAFGESTFNVYPTPPPASEVLALLKEYEAKAADGHQPFVTTPLGAVAAPGVPEVAPCADGAQDLTPSTVVYPASSSTPGAGGQLQLAPPVPALDMVPVPDPPVLALGGPDRPAGAGTGGASVAPQHPTGPFDGTRNAVAPATRLSSSDGHRFLAGQMMNTSSAYHMPAIGAPQLDWEQWFRTIKELPELYEMTDTVVIHQVTAHLRRDHAVMAGWDTVKRTRKSKGEPVSLETFFAHIRHCLFARTRTRAEAYADLVALCNDLHSAGDCRSLAQKLNTIFSNLFPEQVSDAFELEPVNWFHAVMRVYGALLDLRDLPIQRRSSTLSKAWGASPFDIGDLYRRFLGPAQQAPSGDACRALAEGFLAAVYQRLEEAHEVYEARRMAGAPPVSAQYAAHVVEVPPRRVSFADEPTDSADDAVTEPDVVLAGAPLRERPGFYTRSTGPAPARRGDPAGDPHRPAKRQRLPLQASAAQPVTSAPAVRPAPARGLGQQNQAREEHAPPGCRFSDMCAAMGIARSQAQCLELARTGRCIFCGERRHTGLGQCPMARDKDQSRLRTVRRARAAYHADVRDHGLAAAVTSRGGTAPPQ